MKHGRDRYFEDMERHWAAIGDFMRTAMHTVAMEAGGEALAQKVARYAEPEASLPHPTILEILEQHSPGASDRVFSIVESLASGTQHRPFAPKRGAFKESFGARYPSDKKA